MSSVVLSIRVSATVLPAWLDGATLTALGGIGLIALAVYVWYLWSLARLFPELGLPASNGWIPLWNDWQLIQRAGLPGWTAVLGLVPGLSLVKFVFVVMAVHRINVEHGQSAGMTVLGFFIRPLWATVLGSRLMASVSGLPSARVPRGLVTYGPDGHPYPLLLESAVPQRSEPQRQEPPLQGTQPGLPAGSFAFDPVALPTAPPATPHSESAPNPWGFGRTTEDNFQRLANESPLSGSAMDEEGYARPFSWPEAQAPVPSVPTPAAAPVTVPLPTLVPEAVPAADVLVSERDTSYRDDEELDQTVVVARGPKWVLELPDGRELALEGADVVVGRRPTALEESEVLVIPDPTRTISKSHARLRRNDDEWTIEDLGSTNGVFLLSAEGEIEAAPGAQHRLGEHFTIGTLDLRLRRID